MTLVRLATFVRESAQPPTLEQSAEGNANSCQFQFLPTSGFSPNGGIFLDSDIGATSAKAILEQSKTGDPLKHNLTTTYDDIAADYGNPNGKVANDAYSQAVRTTMLASYLNSYETKYFFDPETGMWEAKGNMSEAAIVVGAAKSRWTQ
jgi:hypothetical protein